MIMRKFLISSLTALGLMAGAVPVIAQGATLTIQGNFSDGINPPTPFSGTVTTTPPDVITVQSVAIVPQTAPVGTTRTMTVKATSSLGLPLTGTINPISGMTFTPVTGQPAGTFVWTFVF